jgi:hypothetical protein
MCQRELFDPAIAVMMSAEAVNRPMDTFIKLLATSLRVPGGREEAHGTGNRLDSSDYRAMSGNSAD